VHEITLVVVVAQTVDELVTVHPAEHLVGAQLVGCEHRPPVDRADREEVLGSGDVLPKVEGARRQWRADRALRPAMRSPGRPDPSRVVQRQVWRLIDLWFPPRKIPLEDGTAVLLPVLVIVAAHSRSVTAQIIPTRKTEDLLLGSWELIRRGRLAFPCFNHGHGHI
jgi:hypothetical protein